MRLEDKEPVCLRIGQRLDEPGIQVDEHRSVGADAYGKCKYRYQGESWIFGQHSHAIAQVLPKRLHQPLPALRTLFILAVSAPTAYEKPHPLFEPDTIEVVPLRHVGENHFVPDLQAFADFNGVHRAASEYDVHPHSFRSIIHELEDSYLAVRLAIDGPTHVKHIFQVLKLDGSIHTQVGPRSQRERIGYMHVHSHGSVLDGRIDSENAAIHNAISRVYRRFLSGHYVLCLCLRNLYFRLEPFRISYSRELCSGRHLLSLFHRHKLEHSVHPRANVQRIV